MVQPLPGNLGDVGSVPQIADDSQGNLFGRTWQGHNIFDENFQEFIKFLRISIHYLSSFKKSLDGTRESNCHNIPNPVV
jgi:hypothetical protein